MIKYIERKGYRGGTEIDIVRMVVPLPQAEFAQKLMGNLAITTYVPDGEDSSGKQKGRLMTPAEIVARANEISELAFADFKTREWLLDLPMPKPATEDTP